MRQVQRSVVVGVHWSDSARAAVEVAAEAAYAQRLPLRLVYAVEPSSVAARVVSRLGRELDTVQHKAAERLFDEVVDVLALTHPGLVVTTRLAHGSPAEVLVEESLRAERVVVGGRGAHPAELHVVGGTALQVAASAACPVVLTPSAIPTVPRHTVVVGVDGHEGSEAALEFAFRAASLLDEPLLAVHAWTDPARLMPHEQLPLVYDPELVAIEERLAMAEAMAGFAETYPDVKVDTRVVHAHAVHAIVSAEPAARLVVVGRRGRRLGPVLLGSVSHGVLHHATCPAVVVPSRPVDPS